MSGNRSAATRCHTNCARHLVVSASARTSSAPVGCVLGGTARPASQVPSASKCSMMTAVPPERIVKLTATCGAEWYSGAGDRICQAIAVKQQLPKLVDGQQLTRRYVRHRPDDALWACRWFPTSTAWRRRATHPESAWREGLWSPSSRFRTRVPAPGAIHDDGNFNGRTVPNAFKRHVTLLLGEDQHPRLAVVDDVGDPSAVRNELTQV